MAASAAAIGEQNSANTTISPSRFFIGRYEAGIETRQDVLTLSTALINLLRHLLLSLLDLLLLPVQCTRHLLHMLLVYLDGLPMLLRRFHQVEHLIFNLRNPPFTSIDFRQHRAIFLVGSDPMKAVLSFDKLSLVILQLPFQRTALPLGLLNSGVI